MTRTLTTCVRETQIAREESKNGAKGCLGGQLSVQLLIVPRVMTSQFVLELCDVGSEPAWDSLSLSLSLSHSVTLLLAISQNKNRLQKHNTTPKNWMKQRHPGETLTLRTEADHVVSWATNNVNLTLTTET